MIKQKKKESKRPTVPVVANIDINVEPKTNPNQTVKRNARIAHVIFGLLLSSRQNSEDR